MDQAEAAEKIWKKAETFSKQEEIDSFMAVIYFVNCALMQSCVPSAMGGLKRFLAKKTILVLAIVY